MKRLAITGDRNRPGLVDYTGAFRPQALRFVRGGSEGSRVVALDATRSPAAHRTAIAKAIVETRPEQLGIFSHGFTRRLQFGYDLSTASHLAAALDVVGCVRVGLYACNAAGGPGVGGDGGFADKLRDEMGESATRIVAHQTRGHTTSNPHVRLFDGASGVGGVEVVQRGSPLWRRWCQRLRDVDDSLRWDLLTMSIEEIRAALA